MALKLDVNYKGVVIKDAYVTVVVLPTLGAGTGSYISIGEFEIYNMTALLSR